MENKYNLIETLQERESVLYVIIPGLNGPARGSGEHICMIKYYKDILPDLLFN